MPDSDYHFSLGIEIDGSDIRVGDVIVDQGGYHGGESFAWRSSKSERERSVYFPLAWKVTEIYTMNGKRCLRFDCLREDAAKRWNNGSGAVVVDERYRVLRSFNSTRPMSDFPHHCPYCGRACWIGFSSIEHANGLSCR